jgi:hypothetical protein
VETRDFLNYLSGRLWLSRWLLLNGILQIREGMDFGC